MEEVRDSGRKGKKGKLDAKMPSRQILLTCLTGTDQSWRGCAYPISADSNFISHTQFLAGSDPEKNPLAQEKRGASSTYSRTLGYFSPC